MSDMIIATVVFGDGVYRRMADVLEYSVAAHCPTAEFVRVELEPHTHIKGVPDHVPANIHKKQAWGDIVNEHEGRNIALLDCDTAVLGDLSGVFENDFDLAYTVRDHRVRINAGVMFLRSNETTRRFFGKWNTMNTVLASEEERPKLHARLRKYAGLDQAAFSISLEAIEFPMNTLELPCEIYNSVDQTWGAFSDETLILHIKGRLRRLALSDLPPEKSRTLETPIRVWRDLESRAMQLTGV